MSELFGYVNEIYYKNKSIYSVSVLEKYWVAQCGWLCLCIKVDMGMTIKNFWKLFFYWVNREHYIKFIVIK